MEHHIKRAQMLIVIAIAVNLAVFAALYVSISSQMGGIRSDIDSLGSKMRDLDYRASEQLRALSQNMSAVKGGVDENREGLTQVGASLDRLGDEIQRVGNESQQGIQGIRSALNYTGIIDTALDSVVLIIWTDKESVVGSGFFVSGNAILTAKHVLDDFKGKPIRVKTRGGELYITAVIYDDESRDVTVLRAPVNSTSYLEIGDSGLLAPGSKVFALGAPEGFAFSASEGIVSAVRGVDDIEGETGVELDLGEDVTVVQTDAAITHGNSGGPLIDNAGRVVGLNSFGVSVAEGGKYTDVEGLNFAISSGDLKDVCTAAGL